MFSHYHRLRLKHMFERPPLYDIFSEKEIGMHFEQWIAENNDYWESNSYIDYNKLDLKKLYTFSSFFGAALFNLPTPDIKLTKSGLDILLKYIGPKEQEIVNTCIIQENYEFLGQNRILFSPEYYTFNAVLKRLNILYKFSKESSILDSNYINDIIDNMNNMKSSSKTQSNRWLTHVLVISCLNITGETVKYFTQHISNYFEENTFLDACIRIVIVSKLVDSNARDQYNDSKGLFEMIAPLIYMNISLENSMKHYGEDHKFIPYQSLTLCMGSSIYESECNTSESDSSSSNSRPNSMLFSNVMKTVDSSGYNSPSNTSIDFDCDVSTSSRDSLNLSNASDDSGCLDDSLNNSFGDKLKRKFDNMRLYYTNDLEEKYDDIINEALDNNCEVSICITAIQGYTRKEDLVKRYIKKIEDNIEKDYQGAIQFQCHIWDSDIDKFLDFICKYKNKPNVYFGVIIDQSYYYNLQKYIDTDDPTEELMYDTFSANKFRPKLGSKSINNMIQSSDISSYIRNPNKYGLISTSISFNAIHEKLKDTANKKEIYIINQEHLVNNNKYKTSGSNNPVCTGINTNIINMSGVNTPLYCSSSTINLITLVPITGPLNTSDIFSNNLKNYLTRVGLYLIRFIYMMNIVSFIENPREGIINTLKEFQLAISIIGASRMVAAMTMNPIKDSWSCDNAISECWKTITDLKDNIKYESFYQDNIEQANKMINDKIELDSTSDNAKQLLYNLINELEVNKGRPKTITCPTTKRSSRNQMNMKDEIPGCLPYIDSMTYKDANNNNKIFPSSLVAFLYFSFGSPANEISFNQIVRLVEYLSKDTNTIVATIKNIKKSITVFGDVEEENILAYYSKIIDCIDNNVCINLDIKLPNMEKNKDTFILRVNRSHFISCIIRL